MSAPATSAHPSTPYHPSPISSHSRDEEADLSIRLLPVAQETTPTPARRRRRVAAWILLGALCFLGLTAVAAWDKGLFSKINRDINVVNGTAIEPNTNEAYPLVLSVEGRPHRLAGLFLQARKLPKTEITMKIFVLGVYIDEEQAKTFLKRFKGKPAGSSKTDPKFLELVRELTTGRIASRLEFRMAFSPPGSQMYDHWYKDVHEQFKHQLGDSEQDRVRLEHLDQTFKTWFKTEPFRKGDRFFWCWSAGAGGGGRATLTYNDVLNKSPATDPLFGKAMLLHELLENGPPLLNLFERFFD